MNTNKFDQVISAKDIADQINNEMFSKLNFMKLELKKEETVRLKFTNKQISVIQNYCNDLGYNMTMNDQKQMIKVTSSHNDINSEDNITSIITNLKYGFITRISNGIHYGYLKNHMFIPKWNMKDEFRMYNILKSNLPKMFETNNKKLVKILCGIPELDIIF